MSRRFLVTGGLGCLGAPLVRALVAAGHSVVVLDNGSRGRHTRLVNDGDAITVMLGDVRSLYDVSRAMFGCQSVIHLAAVNGTSNFYSHPGRVLGVGVKGMLNVMDACVGAGVDELFVASSSEVYQTPPIVPTPEDIPLVVPDIHNPRYSYGGSKIVTELLARHYVQDKFKRVVIFRPHNVYGPDFGEDHVIPAFIRRMEFLDKKHPGGVLRFPIEGTGDETRSFCHVDDAVAQIMLLIEKGEHHEVYNVGCQDEVSIGWLAHKIASYFDRQIAIESGPAKQGGADRRCPDMTKIRSLGYVNKHTLHNGGLDKTVSWYRYAP